MLIKVNIATLCYQKSRPNKATRFKLGAGSRTRTYEALRREIYSLL